MRFDKFTTLAQEAISAAQSAASGAGNPEITPLHVLSAMLAEKSSATSALLLKAGVDPTRVRDVAEAELRRLPKVQGGS
ncbi:MAG: Clp protease N-terminal domain-containing protein, partial [bacterium]